MNEKFERSNEFKIDSISVDDWESYRDLWLDALTSDPQAFGYSLEEISSRTKEDWEENIKKCNNVNNARHIIKTENDYIGMMGYFPKGEGNVNIYGVYVKKEYRGQGISDKIMESILNSLDNNDEIKKITLTVNKEQKVAVDFYKRFGFEEVGVIKDVKMGNGEIYDELSMEKEIK